MISALGVLVMFVAQLLVWLGGLAATCFLAGRLGLRVKAMKWSPVHGFSAEFFPPEEEPQSGKT
jgi:hypothetical protein